MVVTKERQVDTIIPLLHDNQIITDELDKANIFNDYFISQSVLDESNARFPSCLNTSSVQIDQKIITPVDTYEVLINLGPSKATGPDGVSNPLLTEAAVPIAEPL